MVESLSVQALRKTLGDLNNKDKLEYVKKLTKNKRFSKIRFIVLARPYKYKYCTFHRRIIYYPLNIGEIIKIRELYRLGLSHKVPYRPTTSNIPEGRVCCKVVEPFDEDCDCYGCYRMK